MRNLRLRRRLKIAVSDGGDPRMLRARCVRENLVEYAPLTLLSVFILESLGPREVLVHGLCACLLLGRLAGAHGVSQTKEVFKYRFFGTAMTFAALVDSAVSLLVLYLSRLSTEDAIRTQLYRCVTVALGQNIEFYP